MEDHTLENEISLLDIAVVIAENWLLLILVPLFAGVMAYGVISATTPRVYETEALLAINEREAALVQAAPVLNKAMLESSHLDGYSGSLSQARRALLEDSFTVTKEPNSEFYRLRVRGEDPLKVEALLGSVIQSLISTSIPNPVELARLNQRIERASASLEELENGLASVSSILASKDDTSGISGGELGAAVVSLVSSIEQRRAELFGLELEIEGSVRTEDVIQPPTQPVETKSRGVLVPVIAAILIVGLLILIFAFVREGIRNASNDPAQFAKVNRIRRAFRLKPLVAE